MNNSTNKQCKPDFLNQSTGHFDTQAMITLIIWVACLVHSVIRNSSSSQVAKLTLSEPILVNDTNGKNNIEIT
jgi:hypothetical protein